MADVLFALSSGIPVAIGAAILKYRLYDIDLLIHRTLVYGVLTACVAEAFYQQAAQGAYSARVNRLVGSLASPRADLSAELEAALDWGATSGADCLLGVVLGSFR